MNRRNKPALPLSVAPLVPLHEPDLAPELKEAVLAAVRWAWEVLGTEGPTIDRDEEEEIVSTRMELLLNAYNDDLRRARWLQDFETVVRGPSHITADGRVTKKPDLIFRPLHPSRVTNKSYWGWVVECKIIDRPRGRKVSAYRDHGVQRFASGEYAARMPSGAMVAYVRDGSEPFPTLLQALTGKVGTTQVRRGDSADRCESQHDRSGLANPCVAITLTHLWLQVKS